MSFPFQELFGGVEPMGRGHMATVPSSVSTLRVLVLAMQPDCQELNSELESHERRITAGGLEVKVPLIT